MQMHRRSPSSESRMNSGMNAIEFPSLRSSLLLAAVLLAACTVGPDYVRPPAPATSGYTSEPLASLQDGSGQQLSPGQNPDADWWSGFHSTALDATMQQALAGNRGL